MKKLWMVGTVLAGGMAMSAQADAFLIDGFGDAQEEVRVTSGDFSAGNESASSAPMSITDTDFVGAMRTLTATMTGTGGTGAIEGEVGGNSYAHSQASGVFGFTQVDWTDFEPIDLESNEGLFLQLLASDLGGKLEFTINDSTLQQDLNAITPGDGTTTLTFRLSDFDSVENITSMSMRIDGTQQTDLDLRIGRIEVPAPGVIGLLGAGFLGLALATRRRIGVEKS